MASKVFNEKIKEVRTQVGFTQTELADMAGLTLSKYQAIEDGRTGSTKATKGYIEKIAEVLEIDLDDIYIEDYRNTKIIAIGYGKGGVGKSTTTGETSYHLGVTYKKKVCVIDGDYQMNVTKTLGLEKNKSLSLRALLESDFESPDYSIFDFIQKTKYDNIDCIIADPSLNGIDRVLYSKPLTEAIFYNAIQEVVVKGIYDYIVIDTSPHLGALTINLLFAADKYYMPIKMEAYALDSMESLIETIVFIRKLRSSFRMKEFEISGILRTVVDRRKDITEKVDNDLQNMMAQYLLDVSIPTDTTIEKAQYEKMFTAEYDKRARSIDSYKKFAKEIMK